jgi:hypothetical protein
LGIELAIIRSSLAIAGIKAKASGRLGACSMDEAEPLNGR